MLPRALLRASAHLEGDRLVPHYFTPRDQPWLRALLDEYRHFIGRKCTAWRERLQEPFSPGAPKVKLRIATLVLDELSRPRAEPSAAVPPKEARATLFRAAAQGHAPRAAVLSAAAESLAVSVTELESALFADLRGERRVAELRANLEPAQIVTEANLLIVSSFVRRAARVELVIAGEFRALVRHAKLAGLICREARRPGSADGVVLDVSGPFALFHHSDLYGRALASLIPPLASQGNFTLSAHCALDRSGQLYSLVVQVTQPIQRAFGPQRRDGQLERKFARDFSRIAPGWDLIREPPAIASGEDLIFPDFELVPPSNSQQSWLLEIVGFWTPSYLREKLQRLRAAGIERFLLSVDRNRACNAAELPEDPRILYHKSRVDARAVCALLGLSALPATDRR